jgi:tetratricopeptide (TPR) repeat protein
LLALARDDETEAEKQFKLAQGHPSCRKQARAQLAVLARARRDTLAAQQYEAESNALDPDASWPDPYMDRVFTLRAGPRGVQQSIRLLERDNQFGEAAAAYLDQVSIQPTVWALTGLAVNLARLGRYDEALARIREAVQMDPEDSRGHYTLALVLFSKWEKVVAGNPGAEEAAAGFREVVAEARRATELKADHARAYLFWGLALKFLGEPGAAIKPLQTGLKIEPGMFDLHLGLGQVLAATGDRVGAEVSLKTAATLRPNDPRPPRELARLRDGK